MWPLSRCTHMGQRASSLRADWDVAPQCGGEANMSAVDPGAKLFPVPRGAAGVWHGGTGTVQRCQPPDWPEHIS
jgi:hypothetical protein